MPWINCFLFLIASGSDRQNKTNTDLSIKLITEIKCNSSKSVFPVHKVKMMMLHAPFHLLFCFTSQTILTRSCDIMSSLFLRGAKCTHNVLSPGCLSRKPCFAYGNMVLSNSRSQWWTSTPISPDSDCFQSTVLSWLEVCVHRYVSLCSFIVIHVLVYLHLWNTGL